MIEVQANKKALERATRLLEGVPGGIQQAIVSSFNRSLQAGRTAATREATKHYTLPAAIIRKTMAMHRANKNDLNAELVSRGRREPLYRFKHTPKTDTTGANRRQVRVAVRKGTLKPLGQGFIYHGLVMQRLGATSYPIEQRFSLSVPKILDNDNVVDSVQKAMEETTEKRLAHETRRILEGYGV